LTPLNPSQVISSLLVCLFNHKFLPKDGTGEFNAFDQELISKGKESVLGTLKHHESDGPSTQIQIVNQLIHYSGIQYETAKTKETKLVFTTAFLEHLFRKYK